MRKCKDVIKVESGTLARACLILLLSRCRGFLPHRGGKGSHYDCCSVLGAGGVGGGDDDRPRGRYERGSGESDWIEGGSE
jgi:hypothetical protein